MYLEREKSIWTLESKLKVKVTEEPGESGKTTLPGGELEMDCGRDVGIITEAAYWRKANQIHKWFIDNCANGEDDCSRIDVDTEDLEELLEVCKKVKASCELKEQWVEDGYGWQTHKKDEEIELVEKSGTKFKTVKKALAKEIKVGDLIVDKISEGKTAYRVKEIEDLNDRVCFSVTYVYREELVKNTSVAEELLPTQSGFFFGSTLYDKWYVQQIDYTIETLEKLLEQDKDDYGVYYYYRASW